MVATDSVDQSRAEDINDIFENISVIDKKDSIGEFITHSESEVLVELPRLLKEGSSQFTEVVELHIDTYSDFSAEKNYAVTIFISCEISRP